MIRSLLLELAMELVISRIGKHWKLVVLVVVTGFIAFTFLRFIS